jgi:hypothetical protein
VSVVGGVSARVNALIGSVKGPNVEVKADEVTLVALTYVAEDIYTFAHSRCSRRTRKYLEAAKLRQTYVHCTQDRRPGPIFLLSVFLGPSLF